MITVGARTTASAAPATSGARCRASSSALVDDDGRAGAGRRRGDRRASQVRGPTLFDGYLNRPDATARGLSRDGWFATGDLGAARAGRLPAASSAARSTDLIKSGGYRIGAGEVEAALLEHPGRRRGGGDRRCPTTTSASASSPGSSPSGEPRRAGCADRPRRRRARRRTSARARSASSTRCRATRWARSASGSCGDAAARPARARRLQTWEWIVRPTALLRRSQAAYGEPFTLRTAWPDAPLVARLATRTEIRRVFAAGPDVLQRRRELGVPRAVRRPELDPDAPRAEHLRQRRLLLPAVPRRARCGAGATTIAEIAHAELDTLDAGRAAAHAAADAGADARGDPARRLRQRATPELRDALRARARHDAARLPQLIAMSLVQRDLGARSPWGRFMRAVARDRRAALRADRRGRRPGATPSSPRCKRSPARPREELRDQLVTLLAAGHETTATALAWALERLARHPEALARCATGDDDATSTRPSRRSLRVRPVLIDRRRARSLAPFDARRAHAAARRPRRRRASTSPTAAASCGPTRPRSGPSASSTAARRSRSPTSRSAAASRRCAGRRVRRAGDARGAARGGRTVHAAPRPARTASGCAGAASRSRPRAAGAIVPTR